MTVKIGDIAKVFDSVEQLDPTLIEKVKKAADEAGIAITVETEEERRILHLVAEMMDRAEDTYNKQRGQGKNKFSSVMASVVEILQNDGANLLDIVKGVVRFSERLKTLYNLIK